MEITSYLLGKKAGGGGSTPVLQDKEIEITQNGETTVRADSGYDGLSSVEVTTNVPQPSGTITITENGTDIDVSNYATANVNVSGGSTKYAPRIIKFANYTGTELNYELENLDISNVENMFNMFGMCSNLTTLDLSNLNNTIVTNTGSMFAGCTNLTTIDLSSFYTPNLINVSGMFSNCINLTKIDIRNFVFTSVNNSANMFGLNSTNYVPANCEIIVKDNTQKLWITGNFPRMTNVKTVAEYEASL